MNKRIVTRLASRLFGERRDAQRCDRPPFPTHFIMGLGWRKCLLAILFSSTCAIALLLHRPAQAQLPTDLLATPIPLQTDSMASPSPTLLAATALDQGIQHYQAQQFSQAAQIFQQVANQSQGADRARAFNYLSLAYQKLGQWSEATAAANQSLAWVRSPNAAVPPLILAQTFNVQGQLQLATGQAEAALKTWKQATTAYTKAGDKQGLFGSLLNQAQALQTMGLYQQALVQLDQVAVMLKSEPDNALKATTLRSLGNALRASGNLTDAQKILEQSLTLARQLNAPTAIADSLLGLGNTARALGNLREAVSFYQQAWAATTSTTTQVQAQLNQLNLLLSPEAQARLDESTTPLEEPSGDLQDVRRRGVQGQTQRESAPLTVTDLLAGLRSQLANLPPSRMAIDARVNFAQNLLRLQGDGSTTLPISRQPAQPRNPAIVREAAQLVAMAVQQSRQLVDQRAESYALGTLGYVYEVNQQWSEAQDLTRKALLLSQAIKATDISYRWQWQLGRLLKASGNDSGAIAAYNEAINTLKSLRSDLVTANPDVQFAFRDSVEPVYREYVSILIDPKRGEVTQENLKRARDAIESLQLAELENFFREACLNATTVQIDQVDRQAAVIYPIILPDRLEVITSLPGQPLIHAAANYSQDQLEDLLQGLRRSLIRPTSREFLPLSQRLYKAMILPFEEQLAKGGIKTIVFVLDGGLRNIPMAVLHDGKQYLLEKYSLALTPGLELMDMKPLPREKLKVLAAGLSEGRQGFSPLPSVAFEIGKIETEVPSQVLLNQSFTVGQFRGQIDTFSGPIIHLATHGEFSSKAEDTFVLAWDERIDVRELTALIQEARNKRQAPIELLVLSACRTAIGDNRAALGLSGVAVRAGARSTIGSLWHVDDQATASVMTKFYQEFTNPKLTKAEALRRAQLPLLKEAGYRHPYYWAPFILVGNWL